MSREVQRRLAPLEKDLKEEELSQLKVRARALLISDGDIAKTEECDQDQGPALRKLILDQTKKCWEQEMKATIQREHKERLLREGLSQKKRKELMEEAESAGISDERIKEANNSDDPVTALINLVVTCKQ